MSKAACIIASPETCIGGALSDYVFFFKHIATSHGLLDHELGVKNLLFTKTCQ